eukprot:gb/GFBE01064976.1/.p1 GENE.gb/GFBE01064976.1/~~gb/GFBE01064976.1/.p1  ORF type:complete len:176 (+),score=38.97 gb/GFBE01064976.1/:1-528(+)
MMISLAASGDLAFEPQGNFQDFDDGMRLPSKAPFSIFHVHQKLSSFSMESLSTCAALTNKDLPSLVFADGEDDIDEQEVDEEQEEDDERERGRELEEHAMCEEHRDACEQTVASLTGSRRVQKAGSGELRRVAKFHDLNEICHLDDIIAHEAVEPVRGFRRTCRCHDFGELGFIN